MTVALLNALSLWGTQSTLIRVEVHLSGGLPTFKIVGMSSHAAQATTERVRAAINSCGYTFPVGRLTVNLSPSDVPKHTAGTDLAIAVGILLATQQVSFNASQTGSPVRQAYEPKAWVFLGELSLSGTLLDVSHLLPMLLTLAKDHPHACVMLPRQQLHHLPHLPNLNIMGVSTLNEACQVLTGKTQAVWFKQTVDLNHLKNPILDLCLSDVRGQGEAVRALEIAAAGGHHLLLAGSAGAGKSLLAKRLVSLLPELNA